MEKEEDESLDKRGEKWKKKTQEETKSEKEGEMKPECDLKMESYRSIELCHPFFPSRTIWNGQSIHIQCKTKNQKKKQKEGEIGVQEISRNTTKEANFYFFFEQSQKLLRQLEIIIKVFKIDTMKVTIKALELYRKKPTEN